VSRISLCRIEVSPREVDAGGDLTLKGQVSLSSADDRPRHHVLIEDDDGGLVETIELTRFDGESNQTGEVVVTAPVRSGTHVWRAVCPAQQGSVSDEDASTSFSFTVKPHATRIVVWDAPPTVERGKRHCQLDVEQAGCASDAAMLHSAVSGTRHLTPDTESLCS